MAKIQEDHATALTTLQELHASVLGDNQHELEGLQLQLQDMLKRAQAAEADLTTAKACIKQHSATISEMQDEVKGRWLLVRTSHMCR